MKTYTQFILDLNEAWHPPFKPFPGREESPMSKAIEQSKKNPKLTPEKLEQVRTSPKRSATPFDNSPHPDYDIETSDGNIKIRSKKHPELSVSYTQVGPNQHVQNSTVSNPVKPGQRISVGREMQNIKVFASGRFRPGETLSSLPTSTRRATLNQTSQGMSPRDPSGYQHGKARHLSPKQKANKTKPLLPTTHSGRIVDPNHS